LCSFQDIFFINMSADEIFSIYSTWMRFSMTIVPKFLRLLMKYFNLKIFHFQPPPQHNYSSLRKNIFSMKFNHETRRLKFWCSNIFLLCQEVKNFYHFSSGQLFPLSLYIFTWCWMWSRKKGNCLHKSFKKIKESREVVWGWRGEKWEGVIKFNKIHSSFSINTHKTIIMKFLSLWRPTNNSQGMNAIA
jgi:hypothetical protein